MSSMEIPMSDFSAGALGPGLLVRVAGHWGGVDLLRDAFGEEVREALPEADMLVNLSNDVFGDSLAPISISRSPACAPWRRAVSLRATNTGISALTVPGRAAGPLPGLRGGGGDRRRVTHDRHDSLCPVGQRGRAVGSACWLWGWSRAPAPALVGARVGGRTAH